MLDPKEVTTAATAIIRQLPSLIRWRRLSPEQKSAVVDAITSAVCTLALDIVD
jgi:hypothetical protein